MNWEIAYTNSFEGDPDAGLDYKTPEEIKKAGLTVISGRVPGSFECELMRLGIEQDYALSTNIKNIDKYKDTNVWYFSTFNAFDYSCLHFDSLNANAIVYINGSLALKTNSIIKEYEISEGINEGVNTVVVHILPSGSKRFVAAGGITANTKGIDGAVIVRRQRKCEVKNGYIRTAEIDKEKDCAKIHFTAEVYVRTDCRHELSHLKYRAVVKDDNRTYQTEGDVFGDRIDCFVEVPHPKLWWPKNYGRPCLYDASITILDGGKQLDIFDSKIGVRTVLISSTGENANDISFTVNGNRVFLSGATAGPSELLKCEEDARIEDTVSAAADMNLNILRYEGAYAPESFYDACDKNGILVIQVMPDAESGFTDDIGNIKALSEEAKYQVSRIRNHSSAAAFSFCESRNKVLSGIFESAVKDNAKDIAFIEDTYCGTASFGNTALSFESISKLGMFFTGSVSDVSLPEAGSLEKIVEKTGVGSFADENGNLAGNVSCHIGGSSKETDPSFIAKSISFMFSCEDKTNTEIMKMSQIVQAEKIKRFIELYRANSDRTGGIIAFDLNDGHPLISPSVIDYYLSKKIACSFVKKTLSPLCLMIVKADNGEYNLYAVNDLPYGDQITYIVKDLTGGSSLIKTGISDIVAFSTNSLCGLSLTPGHFYQITWTTRAGRNYSNHYYFSSEDNSFEAYSEALAKAGYGENEKPKAQTK